GNVVNNVELRRQFTAEGMRVRSTNDGESCVHAVERHLGRGQDMIGSIRRAYADLEGDYAVLIARAGQEELWAAKKRSELVGGPGDEFTCVSSDLPSILPLTRTIVRVRDGEIVVLRHDRVEIRRVEDGARVTREPDQDSESMEAAQKGGYPHFVLKEIQEQPKA